MSLNRRRKQQIMQEVKDREAMERYRANQQQQKMSITDFANNANAISENANTIGHGIRKAGTALNNTGMQNFGSNISRFSGQPALQSIKSGAVGGLGNGISGLGTKMAGAQNGLISKAGAGLSKLGTGLAANAGAQGTAAGLGSAATTAGSAGAAGSALGGAATGATAAGAGAGSAAAGAGAAGAAGAGASGAMAAAGPIGWAALAAYTIYNMVSSAQKKNEMKAMQASMNEAQKSQELSENELANQRANLEENRQQNLANMQAQSQQNNDNNQLTQELLSKYQELENPESNIEGSMTGAAAPIEPQSLPALSFEGSANQELDNINSKKQSLMGMLKSMGGKVGDGIRDFSNGYQDNLQNGFKQGDLFKGVLNNEITPSVSDDGTITGGANELKKSLMNRVGEAFGSGARVMTNPWTQAGIAALATRATGGDWADSLNNAYKYGTAKATSNFYNNKLNPGKAPSALQNYTKDDYAADALAKYRDMMSDNNAKKVDYQAYAKKSKEFSDLLKYGMISPEQYTSAMSLLNDNFGNENYAVGVDGAQISNDTRKVNETGRHNLAVEGIQQQNADTGARRVDETITHNRNTESLGQKNYDLGVEKWNAKQASEKQKYIDKQVQNGELIRCTINGQSGYLTPLQFKEARKKYGKGVSRL